MKLKLQSLIAVLVILAASASAQPADDLVDPGLTPASPFYFVEKISEGMETAVASAPVIGSEELAAKVRANHAEERLAEAKAMIERNKTEKAEKLLDRHQKLMNRSATAARDLNNTRFQQQLEQVNSRHLQVLNETRDRAPENARGGLEKAIMNSKDRGRALNTPGRGSPGDNAKPGDKGKNSVPGPLEQNKPEERNQAGEPEEKASGDNRVKQGGNAEEPSGSENRSRSTENPEKDNSSSKNENSGKDTEGNTDAGDRSTSGKSGGSDSPAP